MHVYHFTYSHPGYNIGDIPSVVDFFFASDDMMVAVHHFDNYSNATGYDNVWVYETTMDEKTAKDAAYFVYYNQDDAQQADALMVAVLEKCPSIADGTLILEASQYETPNSLKMLLKILPNETIPSRVLFKAIAYNQEENVRILVDSGRVTDQDGSALAQACEIGKRNLFDLVLPVSNLDAAICTASKNNFEWLDEAFSVRQKERLNHAFESPTSSRARKI